MWRKKKPAYVEWDLVGDATSGFGAVVYLSAAPMVLVHEVDADLPTPDRVAVAIEQWICLVPDKYRLNEEFERFKSIARNLDDYDA
jgi:hypothetical protein